MKYSIVYLQSGGPTPVINATFFGLIEEAKKDKNIDKIFGARFGIEGLTKNDLIDVKKWKPNELKLLLQTPGAILGTSRKNLSSNFEDSDYKKIFDVVSKNNIKGIFVNGGNDSMSNCFKLQKFFESKNADVKVIGLPKTVDNDLYETDFCLGFPSSACYFMNSIKSLSADYISMEKTKVCIVEVMGRETGWLAASASLIEKEFRPDLIFIPEQNLTLKDILTKVKKVYEKKHKCLIVASEGIKIKEIKIKEKDSHGNLLLEGYVGKYLQEQIQNKLNIGCRVILPSLLTRSNPFFISKVDQEMAVRVGSFAFKAATNGRTGIMVGIKRILNNPAKWCLTMPPLEKVEHKTRFMDSLYIDKEGEFTKYFETYLRPLVNDLVPISTTNGSVDLLKFKK